MNKVNKVPKTSEPSTQTFDEIGQNRFKNKDVIKGLQVRLISTIVMLGLLLIYILSGILFTTFKVDMWNQIDIAAYFNMFCSIVIISIASFEMSRMLKVKDWKLQSLIIIFSLILFLFPSSKQAYHFGFYLDIAETFLNKPNGMVQVYFLVVTLIVFVLILLISNFQKQVGIKKAILNSSMQIFIVLAFKTFTILMLSQTDYSLNLKVIDDSLVKGDKWSNWEKGKGTYSYNTVCWIWFMVILGDSFAYLGGLRFGKKQLAPKISPKKTWEGALIGISCATVLGFIYVLFFWFFQPNTLPLFSLMENIYGSNYEWTAYILMIIIALAVPILGLLGDLVFSAIKRAMKVKDFSNLIPGHGGILDRLDSFIFVLGILFFLIGFI